MMRKLSVLPLVLASALNTSWAQEEASAPATIPISGRIFSDIYVPIYLNPLTNNLQQLNASAWLQLDPKLNESTGARFVLTANQFDMTSPSSFELGLREGYAYYQSSGFEFRGGMQILPWGKSDAFNPTDFLTAKNFTFFNPDDEVRRIGATSIWLGWTPSQGTSPLTFTAVWQPVLPKSELLIPAGVLTSNVSPTINVEAPTTSLDNSEGALRVSYAGVNWDASAVIFRGYNHMPEFALVSGTGVVPVTVKQVFHRIQAAGGDISFTWGSFIFRAESAYIWSENNDGTNPLIIPSRWDAVLGVERPIGDRFRAQVQFINRYFPNFTAPTQLIGTDPFLAAVNSQIAQNNALLLNYQDQERPSATTRLSYTHDEKGIEAEIFGVVNFVGGDYLLRPKFSYLLTDALKATIGADYYGGPGTRPLGALKTYNAAFTEVKYSF